MTYSEIIKELGSLPKGYISVKTIQGKKRLYLQYKEGKKLISRYIRDSESETIIAQLKRRKELENELSFLRKELSHNKIAPLSRNALSLTGDIMEKDNVVASFVNGMETFINTRKAPFMILRTHDLRSWLESRAIDSHRTHSRLLRKALRIKENDDISSVLHVYAKTITDDYWFRPLKSTKKYKDILFYDDIYAETALNGTLTDLPKISYATPELTNIGSFEKCWKLIDSHWYMIKRGNTDELFAEWFVSELAKALNIPTAEYEIRDGFIYTRNFAEKTNLEPMRSLAGDDDTYETVSSVIREHCPQLLADYLLLMWFDCLVNNVDRHNENIGFLRDQKTGKILSLTPNFDDNLSLFATGTPKDLSRKKDGMITQFMKFLESDDEIRETYLKMNTPSLTEEILDSILGRSPVDYDIIKVQDFILNGYRRLAEIKNNLL